MAVPKLEQLSKSVVQGPSLATGAIPTKDWMDIPVHFHEGNYAYPAKKEKVEYLNSQKGLSFPNACGRAEASDGERTVKSGLAPSAVQLPPHRILDCSSHRNAYSTATSSAAPA